ncbi:MAG: DUF3226 domain-containing protein [Candidatus Melainabacteria bacterium]|jgi:hypothetical protein
MSRKVLIVEGYDEEKLIEHLREQLDLDFEIINAKGEDKIHQEIKDALIESGERKVICLGVFRDSNDSSNAAFNGFQSFIIRLKKDYSDLEIPTEISSFSDGTPRIGIFFSPGDGINGHLEDLLLQTIDKDLLECIESYTECVESKEKVSNFKKHKIKMRAYFAVVMHDETKPNINKGLENQYFNLDAPQLDELKSFLQEFAKQ